MVIDLNNQRVDVESVLHNSRLFEGVSDTILKNIINVSEYKMVNKGEILLKEGQFNKYLCVLIRGKLTIILDDVIVSTLRRSGDIIGETSSLLGNACNATVVASENCGMVFINSENWNSQESWELRNVLFEVCCRIQNDKITLTSNQYKKLVQFCDSRALEVASNALNLIRNIEINEKSIKFIISNISKRSFATNMVLQKAVLEVAKPLLQDLKQDRMFIETIKESVSNLHTRLNNLAHEGIGINVVIELINAMCYRTEDEVQSLRSKVMQFIDEKNISNK